MNLNRAEKSFNKLLKAFNNAVIGINKIINSLNKNIEENDNKIDEYMAFNNDARRQISRYRSVQNNVLSMLNIDGDQK